MKRIVPHCGAPLVFLLLACAGGGASAADHPILAAETP
jgi:hypothetical protein